MKLHATPLPSNSKSIGLRAQMMQASRGQLGLCNFERLGTACRPRSNSNCPQCMTGSEVAVGIHKMTHPAHQMQSPRQVMWKTPFCSRCCLLTCLLGGSLRCILRWFLKPLPAASTTLHPKRSDISVDCCLEMSWIWLRV